MATGDKKRAVMTDDINNSGSSYPVLGPTGDGSNVTAAFTAAGSRTNISTGEKLSVIFGKIAKWFTDLGTSAFTTLDTSSLTDDNAHVPSSGVVKSAISNLLITDTAEASISVETGNFSISVPITNHGGYSPIGVLTWNLGNRQSGMFITAIVISSGNAIIYGVCTATSFTGYATLNILYKAN